MSMEEDVMDQTQRLFENPEGVLASPLTRRRFLAGTTMAGASAALAACTPTAAPSVAAPSSAPAATSGASVAPSEAATFTLERPLKVLLANHTGFYAMVTPEWEQRTGAKVEFTREAFGPLPLKLTPAFESGGESWDVAYLWRAWVDLYEQYLTPFDELGVTVDESVMLPAAIEAAKGSSGKFYGLPSNIYTYILYCNKKIFADAGVTIPKTYAEFTAAAKQFTTGDQFGYVDGWAPLYLFPKWCVWYHLNGGDLYGPNGEVRFNDPIAIKATQDMIDLLPNMPKEVIESPWGIYDVEAKKVFLGGKAAMMIDYQHIWYESRDPNLSALGEDPVEVAVIPGYGGDLPASGGQFVGRVLRHPEDEPVQGGGARPHQALLERRDPARPAHPAEELHTFEPADESGYPSYIVTVFRLDRSRPPTRSASRPRSRSRSSRATATGPALPIRRSPTSSRPRCPRAFHGADPAAEHKKAQDEIDAYLAANPGF